MEEKRNAFLNDIIPHLPPEQAGKRLDAVLALVSPELGLRGRRRLWKERAVLVDGVPRSPAFRVRGGERIAFAEKAELSETRAWEAIPRPRLIARRGDFVFFSKPAGLHTEALAGSNAPSLAGLIAELSPDVGVSPILLTRLDRGTSGIVAAAVSPEAALFWRGRENAGAVKKCYLAVLEGRPEAYLTAREKLDARGRRRARALPAEAEDLRHTLLHPLGALSAARPSALASAYGPHADLTLALCRIRKGARHQIRAHAAHHGHPLAGDRLYGAGVKAAFCLHHACVCLPGMRVRCPAPWLEELDPSLRAAADRLCGEGDVCSFSSCILLKKRISCRPIEE
jgi:23S rRNA pseudouridine1911/1915/1917 synthase